MTIIVASKGFAGFGKGSHGLRHSTALGARNMLLLLGTLAGAAPVLAQTVPGGNTSPIVYSSVTADQPAETDTNVNGKSADAAADFTVEVESPSHVQSATVPATIDILSKGGRGGDTVNADVGTGPSGPVGGNGGNGGALGLTLEAPLGNTLNPILTALQASAADAYGIRLTSTGGDGGMGSSPLYTSGNGGEGGGGGTAGAITLLMPQNAALPQAFTLVSGTGAAVLLQTTGGNGGEAGSSAALTGSVTGRKGGSGGSAGDIAVNSAAQIAGFNTDLLGAASGLVTLSTGGDGGTGGDATNNAGSATAGGGGNAGNGGNIAVTIAGGTVAAQGPKKSGTGSQEVFDANTNPGDTVALDTSVTAAAIMAWSQGGTGGVAGEANGDSTHGGSGGVGGTGGDVRVDVQSGHTEAISTSGYNSFGVLAVSAGGDGGDGDSGGGVFFRHGGKGAVGGTGGTAIIHVSNDTATPYVKLSTSGDDSDVLVGISLGGGGGTSGDLLDSSSGGGALFSLFMGGLGGTGGAAGQSIVSNGFYDLPPQDGTDAAFHAGNVISTTGTYSRGLVAQSIGGGGGRGGDVTNTSLTSSISIGGKGGTGGEGGFATATNFGIIYTEGTQSSGMFAQSVGGGGGSGGGALSRAIGEQIAISVAVGGHGGTGGYADDANGYNIGQSQTTGANAHALFVQSVGGGGGVGGTAAAQSFADSMPDTPSIQASVSVGGNGGKGGHGGNVQVVNTGLLQTQGQDSYGVFAQSVGGGGGAGGDATTLAMAIHQPKLDLNSSVGGNGGAGGDGGTVDVWNSGLITTDAPTSMGVFAQSVGGGGGDAGSGTVDQGAWYSAGSYSVAITVAVGGQGGVAGNGGNVTVNNYISANSSDPGYFSNVALFSNRDLTGNDGILTQSDMAPAIFAQSIGGGGGNGGASTGKGGNGQVTMNVAVGGGGGTGGNAATGSGDDPEYALPKQAANLTGLVPNPSQVTKVTDYIWDWKDNVKGAWDDKNRLQELYELNTSISNGKPPAFYGLKKSDLTVDVGGGAGGNAGSGGHGGAVTVTSAGGITTHGAMAYAIFAQSIGGGGGAGGASAPVTANDQLHDAVVEATVSVGGKAGSGGDGGTVTATNEAGADIETSGDLAIGIFAQSVGGGGGVAGATTPDSGIGNPWALSFGGAGIDTDAISGKGGTVTATNASIIKTSGDHGIGMLVQSVGGGGGLAAIMGSKLNGETGLYDSDTQADLLRTVQPSLGENWNGRDNIGGVAIANLNSGGQIQTSGTNAFGILAQSIGGGGGLIVVDKNNQVSVNSLASNPDNTAPSNGNKAGVVQVLTQGQTSISTTGDGAAGIVAQSLGGGGAIVNGLKGIDITQGSSGVYQDRWDMGMGGAVNVVNNSDITTTGAYAHGIFVQVASGTGGFIGRDGGGGTIFRSGMGETMFCGGKSVLDGGDCGGAADVRLAAGTITVSGGNSWGVVLESENVSFYIESQFTNVDFSTTSLSIQSGARIFAQGASGGAILLNGSGGNTVTNAGVIDGSQSAGGYAINSVGKSYHVSNLSGGTIAGNFGSHCSGTCSDTGTISSAIDNAGLIEAGSEVDLGGGKLTNSGTFSVHGAKTGTTTLTGDYAGSGRLVLDADYKSGVADRLVIDGKASIEGTVTINATSLRHQRVALVSATGGMVLDPKLTTSQTHLFGTKLESDGQILYATPTARFVEQAGAMGSAQQSVAGHLQTLFDSGADMGDAFTGLSRISADDAYATALNSMSGRALGSLGAFRYQSSRGFVGNLYQGCDDTDGIQRNCVWARAQAGTAKQDETADAQGYHADAQVYEMGVQTDLSDSVTLGVAAAYESARFRDDGSTARISGDSLLAGVGARYEAGALEIAGALDFGYGWYRSRRTILDGVSADLATARPELWSLGAHLSASYRKELGAGYMKPFAELRGVGVHGKAYTESGSSPFNLSVDAGNDFAISGAVGTELGATVDAGSGARLRPFASAAVEFGGANDWLTTARFASQPQSPAFVVRTNAPGTYGRFALGAELMGKKNLDFTISFNPEFGSGYSAYAGVLRLNWRF